MQQANKNIYKVSREVCSFHLMKSVGSILMPTIGDRKIPQTWTQLKSTWIYIQQTHSNNLEWNLEIFKGN